MTNNPLHTSDVLTAMPLGGLGQIGANMMLFTSPSDGANFVIDAGCMFPKQDLYNIRYLTPNFIPYLEQINHLIITHAHEDHIGAIPLLLRYRPTLQIHCSRFAQKVIAAKFAYRNRNINFKIFEDGQPIEIGKSFQLFPVPVHHSTPYAYGFLILKQPENIAALYLSDFKINPRPLFEPAFDLKLFRKLTKRCTRRLLFVDSTNVGTKTMEKDEARLKKNLFKVIKENHTARTYITLFPSNLHRLKMLIEICHQLNKQVVLRGQSLTNFLQWGSELDMLKIPASLIVDEFHPTTPRGQQVILVNGCQGELYGGLNNVLQLEPVHPLAPQAGDLFLFSSRTIPGNEWKINFLYNRIANCGARILTSENHLLHLSGHADQEDITAVIKEYRPTDLVPIHAEAFHLAQFAEFAKRNFKAPVHLLRNFDTLTVPFQQSEKCYIQKTDLDELSIKPLYLLDGDLEISHTAIKERQRVAQHGALFISLSRHTQTVAIKSCGLPNAYQPLAAQVQNFVLNLFVKNYLQENALIEENIRTGLRTYFKDLLGITPQLIFHIH